MTTREILEMAYNAGVASRDAEVAELERAMKFQATGNYDYQEELKEDRDQLRNVLSSYDGSHDMRQGNQNIMPTRAWDKRRIEALTVTEPK